MTIELAIIADDLTGATDTAVQFVKKGVAAAVAVSPEAEFGPLEGPVSVLAVTTESRHLPPHAAFERVVSVVNKAKRHGALRFYKKIDSTFRGNVGAELEALMQAAPAQRLFLVPAFPAGGRTTLNGRQYVDGKPLEATPFSRDPRSAVTESRIPEILSRTTSFPVVCVDRQALASFGANGMAGNGIFVLDAESDEDLAAIATVIQQSESRPICAGAAGFAALLPGLYGMGVVDRQTGRPQTDMVLVVNGSLNEASLVQVAAAREAGVACYELTDKTPAPGLAAAIVQQLNNKRCAVLTTPPLTAAGGSVAFAEAAGRAAAAVLAALPAANAAVFGGETAAAVCRSAGCDTLYPYDEIVAGLTVCSTSAGNSSRTLILKSGGFGPNDVIEKIRTYLKRS